MPSMKSEPCAKLTMRLTPKISDNPAATRKSELAPARPFSSCSRTAAPLKRARSVFPQCAHFLIGRLEARTVRVAPIDHHAAAVAPRELADVSAHRRLVVDRAPVHQAEGRLHVEAVQRLDHLLRLGRACLADRGGDG